MKERQLAYVLGEIQRAAEAGHTLTVRSFANEARGGRLSYLVECSCGWAQAKSSSQGAAFVALAAHVGLVLGDLDAARDEARRVGLVLPATV